MIKSSIVMTNPEQEVAYVNVFILSLPPPSLPKNSNQQLSQYFLKLVFKNKKLFIN
jgi:hypothetical protein